ncbi:hypothetical protein predicted by Glimmer/Critica [Acetobacter senegalensis]|uniref:Uncharacterized protein n=1 Tax=Acetobacter senegalensis TaxID=446692 RepID=A0A0U5EQN1_9PROT|nr:hypothetical protein predicted by Glimmer/Critica [Acetobacter senegalensis]
MHLTLSPHLNDNDHLMHFMFENRCFFDDKHL